MMGYMRLLAIWLTAAVVLSTPLRATADEKARARALFESGTSHYNLTEYKEALTDFKEGYRLTRDATFLFNIAQCYRQLGDPAAAANFYRSYRRESPDATNRSEVDRLIDEMDRAAQSQHAPPQETIVPQPSPPTTPVPSTEVALTVSTEPPKKPITKKPWFWVTIGAAAVVVAGVTVGIVLGTSSKAPTPNVGTVNGN